MAIDLDLSRPRLFIPFLGVNGSSGFLFIFLVRRSGGLETGCL